MNLTFKQKLVAWIATVTVAILLGWAFHVGPAFFRPSFVVLDGNTPSVLYHAEYKSHANPNQVMRVTIGLKLQKEAELEQLLAAQSDPSRPEFRQYLTPEQFAAHFSPTQADVNRVVDYYRSLGLTVVAVSSNRLLVEVEGTTDQLEKAFNVHINQYNLQGALGIPDGTYVSNDQDPRIPASLQNVVESVSGLSDFAQFRSKLVRNSKVAPRGTPRGYSPQDIATAYEFPNQNNSGAAVKYSGKGRVVAIATAYGYNQSDVDDYWKQFGIKRTGTITNIPINGTTTKTDDETTLDLETVGAQAPGADILMYIGANPAFTTFTKTFNQIVVDNKADVISVSWGLCEAGTGQAQMNTEAAVFKQAAAQGIAVFASAGDDGAYDCSTKKPQYSVDYPSSDLNVTAVGGTSLYFFWGTRSSEEVWTGGGGGISNTWPQPSWQSGPGVPSNGKRNTSDVAMNADPNTGYAILVNGQWIQIGGTSVSAPDWAALWTLAVEAKGHRLGDANRTFYRIGASPDYSSVFYDITRGDNGNGRGPGYSAGPNWDHPTGWGVPHGGALIDWLVKDNPPAQVPPAGSIPVLTTPSASGSGGSR
jgi:kumamolisin